MGVNPQTIKTVENILSLKARSVDVVGGVQSATQGEAIDAGISAANALHSLAAIVSNNFGKLAPHLLAVNLARDGWKMREEIETHGKCTDATVLSAASNVAAVLTYVGTAVATAAAAPAAAIAVVGIGITVSAALGVAAIVQHKDSTDILDYIQNLLDKAMDTASLFGSGLVSFFEQQAASLAAGIYRTLERISDVFLSFALELAAMGDIKNQTQIASTIPSPLILDLNGDGVKTTSLSPWTYFDHAADGFAERTGWVSAEDGLLVRDLNGNGIIDSGRELFGSETVLASGRKASNGFEALKELDLNNDGVMNAADPVFAELRVWKDVNGNGRTDDGELLTLEQAGVHGINVAYNNSNVVDAHGNAHKQVGSYITTSGETRTATDIWFKTNATYSRPTNWVDVPEDIALLPDAQGYGKMRDLHQAMAMDATGKLKALVTAFTQADTPEDRDALVTQIIYHWAGVENVDPYSRASRTLYGNAIGDARKLEALEEFMGEEWYGIWCWGTRDPNPHGKAAPVLLQAWDKLKALVHGQLMTQSHLQGLFQQIMYRWDLEIEGLVGDLSGVAATLAQQIEADREAGLTQLGDFLHSLKGMNMLGRLDVDGLKASLVPLGSDVEHTMAVALAGWVGNNVPTEGNDVLRGTQFDDVIDGRGGNDRLLGRSGNDTLIGGADNTLVSCWSLKGRRWRGCAASNEGWRAAA